ncbi:helix-turn-helix domain-containing protein [Sphingobium sp. WTD-1]|uniref:helix-turn-helix domain-containing protein n=1 Tax=Sphingobium sp. WTD-1 TaxID=2979467 RepID=UPI0024DE04C2|nr:helix-turn-helix domain-containing protein [Sphingobium sp. WTD-1]WIA57668.1 helix-turn-helix domain-containing protein [Sphingobium sp. WTD-1]
MNNQDDGELIGDPALIRLLSSPMRQELVDTLAALGGEATVATLAKELGRPADGLYYHLRALVAAGLICEVPAHEKGERRYRLASRGGGPIRLAYDLNPEGNGAEIRSFARGLLQIAERDFHEALSNVDAVVSGPRRELWASRNKGWLSNDDLIEVNALLERLSELTSQPKMDGKEHLISLVFSLAPINPLPKRRAPGSPKAR